RTPEWRAPERSGHEGRAKKESTTKEEWREAAKASVHEKSVVKERVVSAHESDRLAGERGEDVTGRRESTHSSARSCRRKRARCKGARSNRSNRPPGGRKYSGSGWSAAAKSTRKSTAGPDAAAHADPAAKATATTTAAHLRVN